MANTASLNNVRASNNFAALNNNLGLTGGNITIEAWYNPQSQPATNATWGMFHHGSTTNLISEAVRYRDVAGTKQLHLLRTKEGVADNAATYNVTLTTGTWIHVVLVYNGTNVLLYTAPQGGTHTQRASVASSGNGSGFTIPNFMAVGTYVRVNSSGDSYATCIANTDTTTNNPSNALMDEIRVWSTARSTAQMDANFETELVGNETGLVAYYKFINDLLDTTSGAFNLTGNGSTTYSSNVPFGAFTASPLMHMMGISGGLM